MKVFFWTNFIDKLYQNDGIVGGIGVQMSFWAKEFVKHDWKVFTFANKRYQYDGITFLKLYNIRYLSYFIEILLSIAYLLYFRPQLICIRGASRSLFHLSILSKIFSVKLIMFGASDTDFIPGKELIKSNLHRKMYQCGLKMTKYVVAQNECQRKLLTKHYKEVRTCIIPNIWVLQKSSFVEKDIDFLWVSNIRELKRPEWVVGLAKRNPQYNFTMIGANLDKDLYKKCEEEASKLKNLFFLGRKSFAEVNTYFNRAKCFLCTSTIEGFPNTFLQSWSNYIPVISTFDPSDVLKKKSIGFYAENFEDLNKYVSEMMENKNTYLWMQNNIETYFDKNHNSAIMYFNLIRAFDII